MLHKIDFCVINACSVERRFFGKANVCCAPDYLVFLTQRPRNKFKVNGPISDPECGQLQGLTTLARDNT